MNKMRKLSLEKPPMDKPFLMGFVDDAGNQYMSVVFYDEQGNLKLRTMTEDLLMPQDPSERLKNFHRTTWTELEE